jgi:hypothetical protein
MVEVAALAVVAKLLVPTVGRAIRNQKQELQTQVVVVEVLAILTPITAPMLEAKLVDLVLSLLNNPQLLIYKTLLVCGL